MAVVKRISSKAKVGKIEKYLKQEEKTEEKLISGMNCDSDNFAKQCEMTSMLYDKNQEKNDRKYYHIIQSFSPKDNDKLTLEQAHKIGEQFAEKNFKGYEVLIVTHKDKEHIHNHFVVNSVSLENGKKYRADNKSLWQLRRTSNELCKENNLTNSIQPLDRRTKEKITSGELRKMVRGEDTWKSDLKAQITECARTSNTIEEFKNRMKEKYNVEVTERVRTSKGQKSTIYQYKGEGFNKPCGDFRLGEEYKKEYIENGIIRRSEEKARGKDTRTNAGQSAGAEQRTPRPITTEEVVRADNYLARRNNQNAEKVDKQVDERIRSHRQQREDFERVNRETETSRNQSQGTRADREPSHEKNQGIERER